MQCGATISVEAPTTEYDVAHLGRLCRPLPCTTAVERIDLCEHCPFITLKCLLTSSRQDVQLLQHVSLSVGGTAASQGIHWCLPLAQTEIGRITGTSHPSDQQKLPIVIYMDLNTGLSCLLWVL